MSNPDLSSFLSYDLQRRASVLIRAGRLKGITLQGDSLEGVVLDDTSFPYLVRIDHLSSEPVCHCHCVERQKDTFCVHGAAVLMHHYDQIVTNVSQNKDKHTHEVESIREREITRRKQRSQEESLDIIELNSFPQGGGWYQVESASGNTYHVIIRSSQLDLNECTCMDYQVNRLGTCKHIEAVVQHFDLNKQSFNPERHVVYMDYECGCITFFGDRSTLPDSIDTLFDNDGNFHGEQVENPLEILQKRHELDVLSTVRSYFNDQQHQKKRLKERETWHARLLNNYGDLFTKFNAPAEMIDDISVLLGQQKVIVAEGIDSDKHKQALLAAYVLEQEQRIQRLMIVTTDARQKYWEYEVEQLLGHHVLQKNFQVPTALFSDLQVYVVSYEQVVRDFKHIQKIIPDVLIVDEAQHIQDWRTKTGAVIKNIAAEYIFVLSSIDLFKQPDVLYSIVQIVDQNILGPLWYFNQEYVQFNDQGNVIGMRNKTSLEHTLKQVIVSSRSMVNGQVLVEPYTCHVSDDVKKAEQELFSFHACNDDCFHQSNTYFETLFGLQKNHQAQSNSLKINVLIQLWRGLLTHMQAPVVIHASQESFLRLAAEALYKMELRFISLHEDSSQDQRQHLFHSWKENPQGSILTVSDRILSEIQLPEDAMHIHLHMPWHPRLFQQRIALCNSNLHFVILYEQTFEELVYHAYRGQLSWGHEPIWPTKADELVVVSNNKDAYAELFLWVKNNVEAQHSHKQANDHMHNVSAKTDAQKLESLLLESLHRLQSEKNIPQSLQADLIRILKEQGRSNS